jgi:probable HAF family extracellular repeat protein
MATRINDLGQIVGFTFNEGGERRAFSWEDGMMTDLSLPLGGPGSHVAGLNAQCEVIGSTIGSPHRNGLVKRSFGASIPLRAYSAGSCPTSCRSNTRTS